ncbi:MAG TPA: carboxypeptidase-like regulatory domain-containing protein [Bryobacteraceae bacterium]|nr:carboxypeptidase-like regulatory domain-containing protein [Bryobacteraceae bacterium]
MASFKTWLVLLLISAAHALGVPEAMAGVKGNVTLGDAPFAGVEVEASSSSIGQFWETSTDSSGKYVLDALPVGRYTVWAEASGHGCIVIPNVLVKDGVRTMRNFHFAKGKRYPGCESLKPKKNGRTN